MVWVSLDHTRQLNYSKLVHESPSLTIYAIPSLDRPDVQWRKAFGKNSNGGWNTLCSVEEMGCKIWKIFERVCAQVVSHREQHDLERREAIFPTPMDCYSWCDKRGIVILFFPIPNGINEELLIRNSFFLFFFFFFCFCPGALCAFLDRMHCSRHEHPPWGPGAVFFGTVSDFLFEKRRWTMFCRVTVGFR